MEIRPLTAADLYPELLQDFNHIQNWTHQWINTPHGWQLQAISGSRRWNEEKRRWMVTYLAEHLKRKGQLVGAFDGNRLAGFAAVDGPVIEGYADLTLLFVDDLYKRQGLGRALFHHAATAAKALGAQKLFIPAIPSQETVAFYFAMGCIDARQVIPAFVDSDKERWLELPI